MKVRFLLDENLSPDVVTALKRLETDIDAKRVGMPGVPPPGTTDPDILAFCEADKRLLVTDNRATMPVYLAAHTEHGDHHWGVFETRHALSIGELAAELHLVWAASEAEEWIDRLEWIPF